MRLMVLSVALLLSVATGAPAQSFECRNARTPVEKLICAEASLRELDEHLGRYYAAARAAVQGAASCLQTDQAQWLKSTRDACRDRACLETAYLNRLAELDPLQPGATAIRNIPLPAVPALVWVIGPAADKSAAPPKPAATPLEAIGTIVNEVSGGDGFILHTRDGRRVPLALLMFLDGGTPEHLSALAKETGATFRARGYAATDGARTSFEPSRCTFIHRLPGAAGRMEVAVGYQFE